MSDPEDQSTTSDSDSETGTARQVTTNPFSIRKDNHAKGAGTHMTLSGVKDLTEARSALTEQKIDTSGTTNSRPQKGYPSTDLTRSSSESDELPILSGRKRNRSAVAIIVSSGDESEVNETRLDTRDRSRKRVDVVDKSSHTRRQSRPMPSPRVNARRLLLGGSTGSAPVPRLCLQKVVTPNKPSKVNTQSSARRRTRSSGKAEQPASPTRRRTRLSTAMEKQPTAASIVLDDGIHDGILDDDASDDGVPMPSEVRSTAVQTPTKAVVVASEEESDEDLVLSPTKRRRIHLNEESPTHATDVVSKQQEEDLEEDLEDLQETGKWLLLARLLYTH